MFFSEKFLLKIYSLLPWQLEKTYDCSNNYTRKEKKEEISPILAFKNK